MNQSTTVRPRATVTGLLLIALTLTAAACSPNACVGGVGVCQSNPLSMSYVVIDPSGSQDGAIGRQADAVRAIAERGGMSLTVVRLGTRQTTASVIARVDLARADQNNPEAISTRAALLDRLQQVVRRALTRRTNQSDVFGTLAFVHDDASQQRSTKDGHAVWILGDSEPAIRGLLWTHQVPAPPVAIEQVRTAYPHLNYRGLRITFVLGADVAAERKPTSYISRLSDALLAVCEAAQADACQTTTAITEATS